MEKPQAILEPVTSFFTDMFESVNQKVAGSSLGNIASDISSKSESFVNGILDTLNLSDMMSSGQGQYMKPIDSMLDSMSGSINNAMDGSALVKYSQPTNISSKEDNKEGFIGSTLSKVSSFGSSVTDSMSSMVGGAGDIEDSASVVYKNKHLAMGYNDGRIEIENTEGQYASLQVHQARVNNLYIVDNKLISSSDDGSIAVTDLIRLKVIKQMKGHGSRVEGVVAYGDNIFSISRDRTIKIWEISSTGLSRIIYY